MCHSLGLLKGIKGYVPTSFSSRKYISFLPRQPLENKFSRISFKPKNSQHHMMCKKKDVSLKLTNVKNVGKKGNFENKFVRYINMN